jgi:hypothetical protein
MMKTLRQVLEGCCACFETPLTGLLSMRSFLRAAKNGPHPEERGRAAARARVSKDARRSCSLRLPSALFFAATLMASTGAVAQSDQVALVKVVDGEAFALRDDSRSALGVGQPIFVEDVVETEAGTLGLTFKDGSRLSIGPNSRVQFTEFQFAPAEGRLAFVIDFFRGTLLYVSGVIAKLAPESVQVRTPVATVAVRGTRFLAQVEGRVEGE